MTGRSSSPSRFWIRWTLLTAAGLAVGLAAGFGIGAPTTAIVGMMLVVTVIGAIAGGFAGAIQSFALPPEVPRGLAWALATAGGMAIGLTVGTVGIEMLGFEKGNPTHEAFAIASIGAAAGACIGLAQYGILRRRVRQSGWWVLANTVASGAGFLFGGLAAVGLVGGFRSLAGLAILGATGGLLTGAIGGLAMRRLAARPLEA